MNVLGTEERPLRVAIIGSGPSGFYAAEALFKADLRVEVDMFDRLPTPFGLVRGGVAPDHPKIKSVTRVYDRIASDPRFRFIGNVMVGADLTVEVLRTHYDAIIFACGAESDRRLEIPGEHLRGSHTATEFVGWYNGHPDYCERAFDLSHDVAVIIGQGNVAIDVCRILARSVDELRETDIAEHALDALAKSKVREIHLIGRRGPVQAKFTSAELKEIGELEDCEPVLEPGALELDEASLAELEDAANAGAKKNMALFKDFAARVNSGRGKRCHIRFLLSPVELQGDDRVERVVLERNRLVGEPGNLRAQGTGDRVSLDCGILFRSVGYRGVPVPGVPFDPRRGIFPNVDGRLVDDDAIVSGLYAAGWIKRGPSGIIGTNKPDSKATVDALLGDVPRLRPCTNPSTDAVLRLLIDRGVRPVSYHEWQRIDAAEIQRGLPKGKPREKFTRIRQMLDHLQEDHQRTP